MKQPRYPGFQHVTFAELEVFVARVLQKLAQVQPLDADGAMARNIVAEVFNQMVREVDDGD